MRCFTLLLGVWVVFGAASAFAQAPPGGTLTDQVREAYARTQQYESTIDFRAIRRDGRWEAIDEAQTFVAYDRPTARLRIDTPHFLLVADGSKLRVRTEQFPGQHLEVDQPNPLTYESLAEAWPVINAMPVPDVVFFFADNPIEVLSEGTALAATPQLPAAGEDASVKLIAQTHLGLMTLTLREGTKQLARMRVEAGDPTGDGVVMSLDLLNVRIDQPIKDDTFAFDTTNSQAVEQFSPSNGPGNAPSGGGGGHPLIGKRAPDFTLKDVERNDWALKDHIDADLLVLGFWASWTPASKIYLPAMQKLEAWGREQGLDVQVVLINCGEKPGDITNYLEANETKLPCVLDDFTVSDQYLMQFLPHTVIIGEGVVRHLHSGVHDDYVALLKPELEKLAEQIEARKPKQEVEKADETEAEKQGVQP